MVCECNPISKPVIEWAGGVVQGVVSEFKPQYHQKKKKKKKQHKGKDMNFELPENQVDTND
jgi:hypothetical protein